MINQKQTFKFGDVEFFVDPKNPYITMKLGEEKRSIKKNEIWAMVFAISKSKKQADLIPVQEKEMMTFQRVFRVPVPVDKKAGEFIYFTGDIDIPKTIVQANLTPQQILDANLLANMSKNSL